MVISKNIKLKTESELKLLKMKINNNHRQYDTGQTQIFELEMSAVPITFLNITSGVVIVSQNNGQAVIYEEASDITFIQVQPCFIFKYHY